MNRRHDQSRRPDRRRKHWNALSRRAVRDLHGGGFSIYDIACAAGITVEQVRRILGERRETTTTETQRK